MRIKDKEVLEEYRFHFHFGDSHDVSDRYFLAHNTREAREMFEYACSKRQISPEVDRVEKWNRWSEKWEDITVLATDHLLN